MKPILTLLFSATLLATAPLGAPLHVYMIGDSTMAERAPELAERGWGQLLGQFFDDGVTVHNLAVNGRSTKSFIDEGKWGAVLAQLGRGDILIVQFAHNDQKSEDSTRFTNPATSYRRNLERFVTEARARGAVPILCSPIVRRKFNAKGVLDDTHGLYPLVARSVARDLDVPFIDLQLLTEELVLRAGPEGSKALYTWLAPGETTQYPDGRQDDTHLSPRGAREVARLAAGALAAASPALRKHFKPADVAK